MVTKSYVYKITNLINGKIYIGKSNDPLERWKVHIYNAKTGRGFIISKAIKKYGQENFLFEIIGEYSSEEEAYAAEMEFIKLFNTIENGYNILIGGKNGRSSMPQSLEHRRKISEGLKKFWKTYNKKRTSTILSDEMKLKCSKTHKKTGTVSNELKQTIIDTYNTGKFTKQQICEKFELPRDTINYILGKLVRHGILTEDEKRKHRSEARLGKKLSDEHKANISKGNIGKKMSEESKVKGSLSKLGEKNAMFGKTHSPETKTKMSEFQKNRKRRPLTEAEKENLRQKSTGKKNKPIPQELKDNVYNDYISGNFTKRQICEKHNISNNTATTIIRKYKKQKK